MAACGGGAVHGSVKAEAETSCLPRESETVNLNLCQSTPLRPMLEYWEMEYKGPAEAAAAAAEPPPLEALAQAVTLPLEELPAAPLPLEALSHRQILSWMSKPSSAWQSP